MKKVVVIGGGAAGLAALRILSKYSSQLSFTAYEQSDRVGGTWIYNDPYKPTGIYDNLLTNIPKDVMAFPDLPFSDDLTESYVSHRDVLAYLQSYAQVYDLNKYIQFRHTVLEVDLLADGEAEKETDKRLWRVTVKDDVSGALSTHFYDAVLVCNGHYTVPIVPDIDGSGDFNGEIVHSHDYRSPLPYKDKIVFILGAGPSGTDIAMDTSTEAKKVYLGHNRSRLVSELPDNVEEVFGIKEFSGGDSIVLTDGSLVSADAVILATGYRYSFPFLSERCHPMITNEHVHCYKYLVDLKNPTLFYVGINKAILPFPQFYKQCEVAVAYMLGIIPTPSTEEMQAEHDQLYKKLVVDKGVPERYFHDNRWHQWQYNNELTEMVCGAPLEPYIEKLYKHVLGKRLLSLPRYKQSLYKVDGPDSFQILREFDLDTNS